MVSCTAYAQADDRAIAVDEYADELIHSDHIPKVLTATRLKQPKAETPASITVIGAEKIQALGARNIPEVLRFVPGMFVGHSQAESADAVIYHASGQNYTRRLQVLIDGRSVYKAGIARVIWEEIPLAIEDVSRIEIIRGPSSATYGANAFLATINIITKSPEESLGTQVRYRTGSQGIQDAYLSHSTLTDKGSLRLTSSYLSDDGFEGVDGKRGDDNWNDDNHNKFVNLAYQHALNSDTELNFYAGLGSSYADIDHQDLRDVNGSQFRDTDFGFLQSRITFNFSATHQSQLQMYWQKENRVHERHDTYPTVFFDPLLRQIYQTDPDGTHDLLSALDKDPTDHANINAKIQALPQDGQSLANSLISDPNKDLTETLTGYTDYNYSDQRFDIEWQDTVIWHDRLRTVSSISYRHDENNSEAFFSGRRYNDIFRLFANAEWRITDWLLLNTAGTYEHEKINGEAFSPRVALNWLLSERQSLRLVYSEAIRSPDMIEQQPDMNIIGYNLSDNYLNVSQSPFFQANYSAHRNLEREKIKSHELGYYSIIKRLNLELDIKLYQEELSHLIADPLNLSVQMVDSNLHFTIKGAEAQFKWQPFTADTLWLTLAHMSFDNRGRTGFNSETRLSAEDSATASWHHKGENGWSSTLSYLWLDGFNNGSRLYQRSELQLRKQWQRTKYTPWMSVFWQHQFAHNALGYYSQIYSSKNLYQLQAGLNF